MSVTSPARQILIAEDDDASRALLHKYLTTNGYAVTAVSDGEQALAALRTESAFDLVILDVMMPLRSGFDVLQAARQAGATVPIIMATAVASSSDIVKALGMGADDYVTKPFSFPVLLARIEARMRVRTAPGALPPPLPVRKLAPTEEATASRAAPLAAELGRDAADRHGLVSQLKGWLQRGPPPPLALKVGARLAERYLIEAVLGSGSFGAVFRARHLDLQYPVALKVLTAVNVPGAIDVFRREAQSACRVRHPNAVRVFDFGTLPPSSAFIVMELLEGPTLATLLDKQGKLELDAALSASRAVLAALAAAHQQGLVHRDVKPANVVMHDEASRQVPKLIDFGLARGEEVWGDEEGAVAGSPAYLSPERIRGQAYDGRADVYACGVMLFKLLTGMLPMRGMEHDADSLARWHLTVAPVAPSAINPTLSPALDAVVLKLLAKDPAQRPTADEAESLLETVVWS